MEFMECGSLAFHLEKTNYFTEYQVKFFSAQIVCGMLFLHKKGFIHW